MFDLHHSPPSVPRPHAASQKKMARLSKSFQENLSRENPGFYGVTRLEISPNDNAALMDSVFKMYGKYRHVQQNTLKDLHNEPTRLPRLRKQGSHY
jgi:hypothetical protein